MKKGAHREEYIRRCDRGYEDMLEVYGPAGLDNVAICTVAPEIENVCDAITDLTRRGIVVSLGHSTADLAQGERGIRAGASFITHLFNAMQPFHHRDPGLVGLLGSDLVVHERRPLFYGMIADFIHAEPSVLRIAHRTHPDGLVLVTDAISAMGLPEGKHRIGDCDLDIRGTTVHLANTNTLAGSVATLDGCVRNLLSATGCSRVQALQAGSLHPAQLLGITHRKGTLDYGTDADFILLDAGTLEVRATYIGGCKVWGGYD